MKSVLLDVDGALIDSVPELYRTTCKMWQDLYSQPFPLNEERFTAERPNITTMLDYFSIINGILEEMEYDDEIISAPELKQAFYDKRKERMATSRDEWIAENTLYDGVPEMLAELQAMGIINAVVSSKNEGAIRELFKYHDISKYFKTIVALEKGGRTEQFRLALDNLGIQPQDTIAYDDQGKNLIVARDMGIVPVGAPQGYAKPGELDEFECATIAEFPAAAKRIFNL